MCGICGLLRFDKDTIRKDLLRDMTSMIRHRGPDDDGFFMNSQIGLGMRRLSIIDLEGGDQPIHNENEKVWTVFNGEIYNFKDLRKKLESKGHKFYTNSDTEVIVHLYEEFGLNFVERINGMFAIALWDEEKERLILARDRIGIKPLYYTITGNKLVFGSELKSVLQDKTIKREVNEKALHYYLGFEYVPAPFSIVKGIKKLLPGKMLICETNGETSTKEFWDPNFRNTKGQKNSAYYAERILKILRKSVKNRLVSDVPLGAFLSGGIDSSTIVALMSELMDEPVKTFSIGFQNQSYNELDYAREVANKFGTDHKEKVIKPDIIGLVDNIINHLDEPFADVSVFPTYLVSKFAREDVKVTLSGDGGDELFAGYDWYRASKLDRIYSKIVPKLVRKDIMPKITPFLPPSSKKKTPINMLRRFIKGASYPEEGHQIRWQFFMPPKERDELYSSSFFEDTKDDEPLELIHHYYMANNAGTHPLDRERYVDLHTYLPDDILVKVDRTSMANSLEVRVPFLDHRLVELVTEIPPNYCLNRLKTKYVLKKASSEILPSEIINREKQGFSIPMKNWLKNELYNFMRKTLDKKKIEKQGYFDFEYIDRLIKQHVNGRKNNAHTLWTLIVFQLWHENYMEGKV